MQMWRVDDEQGRMGWKNQSWVKKPILGRDKRSNNDAI